MERGDAEFLSLTGRIPVYLPLADGTREVVGDAKITSDGVIEATVCMSEQSAKMLRVMNEMDIDGLSLSVEAAPAIDVVVYRNEKEIENDG